MNLNPVKRAAARILDAVGINSLGHVVQKRAFSPFIRVVNYHDIPEELSANFETHLRFYSTRFSNVEERELREFLKTGVWPHDKPGLIISLDDGMRSHFETAAPLLEKFGFTGWFFVPAGWVADRNGSNTELPANVGDQKTLTLQQLTYLDQNHVVGCHTETHCRLSFDLRPDVMEFETLGAKRSLEAMLGHPVNIFCWAGGEEFTYSRAAADLIKKGFDLGFMTNTDVVTKSTDPMQLQRTNIEAENPLWLVRFQISGIMDLMYYPKRKRVNTLTR
jgi:peptidoglycan/xylan/chitin deacetylase (PgdA/CDA1 family)